MHGLFGQYLGDHLHLKDAPRLSVRTAAGTPVSLAELDVRRPCAAVSKPILPEASLLISLQLRDVRGYRSWEDGGAPVVADLKAGGIVIQDLKRNPRMAIDRPLHHLAFHIPAAALNEIGADSPSAVVDGLDYRPGESVDDEVIRNLGEVLLPELRRPAPASSLFVDHVMFALVGHVAKRYARWRSAPVAVRGGLAPWQERRAREVIAAHLDGGIGLKDVAQECGLSVSHFCRAFKRSLGTTPHGWLTQQRLDTAKDLLRRGSESLSDVALSCGFADQSHFTRVFTRAIGVSPGLWRRNCQH
jgi:AraC family transcriptional regulator